MDIKIAFPTGAEVDIASTLAADFALSGGMLVMDESLYTATVISLFSDARAGGDDELPAPESGRRGWWGDGVPATGTPEGDRIGSKLWLLYRRKQNEETRRLAVDYVKSALAWAVADGHAEALHVDAAWQDASSGVLHIGVEYELPGGKRESYGFLRKL